MIIGGIILFSWGYHLGKKDEKDKQARKAQKKSIIDYNTISYYQSPNSIMPSAPRLEYQEPPAPIQYIQESSNPICHNYEKN
jgi:hypothetical protein